LSCNLLWKCLLPREVSMEGVTSLSPCQIDLLLTATPHHFHVCTPVSHLCTLEPRHANITRKFYVNLSSIPIHVNHAYVIRCESWTVMYQLIDMVSLFLGLKLHTSAICLSLILVVDFHFPLHYTANTPLLSNHHKLLAHATQTASPRCCSTQSGVRT
jgi:hypothetical protein